MQKVRAQKSSLVFDSCAMPFEDILAIQIHIYHFSDKQGIWECQGKQQNCRQRPEIGRNSQHITFAPPWGFGENVILLALCAHFTAL